MSDPAVSNPLQDAERYQQHQLELQYGYSQANSYQNAYGQALTPSQLNGMRNAYVPTPDPPGTLREIPLPAYEPSWLEKEWNIWKQVFKVIAKQVWPTEPS